MLRRSLPACLSRHLSILFPLTPTHCDHVACSQSTESAQEQADADVRQGQDGAEKGDDGQGRGHDDEAAHTRNPEANKLGNDESSENQLRTDKAIFFQDKDSAAVEPPRLPFPVHLMEYQRMSSKLENLRTRWGLCFLISVAFPRARKWW